ncbi:MAG TPA: hypothetical protein DCG63_03850 [Methylophilaceae bacterium]|nr:hypothetical protein [Methylophilaceae bacterium]
MLFPFALEPTKDDGWSGAQKADNRRLGLFPQGYCISLTPDHKETMDVKKHDFGRGIRCC